MAGGKREEETVLAFVCCLKAAWQLVAVVTCSTAEQLRQLRAHPAIAYLRQSGDRCAARQLAGSLP